MNLFLANTDHDWFEYLRDMVPDEVNFWFPSGGTGFAALKPGEPLLFKAKAPFNAVIGGGHFVRYVKAPASLAWQAFGTKNGAPDFTTFFERIIDQSMKFRVSSRLKSEFNNGVDYYRFDASELRVLPAQAADKPRADFLEWHNDTVFRS